MQLVLSGDEKADELLPLLFDQGSDLLLQVLPDVFSGEKKQHGEGCVMQDDAAATHAAKMSKEEVLCAHRVHEHIRTHKTHECTDTQGMRRAAARVPWGRQRGGRAGARGLECHLGYCRWQSPLKHA